MRSFGQLESRIMTVMWNAGEEMTVGDLRDRLAGDGDVAYTTVITVVERLRSKGWLGRAREGRSYRYWATYGEDEYAAHLIRQVLEDSGDRSAALLSFASSLEPDEASVLREALVRSRGDRPTGRGPSPRETDAEQ